MNTLNVAFVRYLNHTDHNPGRSRKIDEMSADKLGFEDIKVPVKIKDIYKIEKKEFYRYCIFDCENKKKHPIYISNKC